MPIPALVFDLVMLAAILVCAAFYAHKGLLAGIIDFLGTLAALVLAVIAANNFSTLIFDNFFRAGLEARTAEAVVGQGILNLDEVLHSLVGFLPDALIETIAERFGATLDFNSADIAHQIVQNVMAPFIIPIIAIILFFVVFLLLRVLLAVLRSVLTGVNRIPLVGTANRLLGAAMGVLVGLLYVFLLLCVVWAIDAADGVDGFGAGWFGQSIVWRITQNMNIFSVGSP